MLITVAILAIIWAILTIGLRLIPMSDGGKRWLSLLALSVSVFVAVIFELTPQGADIEPYCATMAHQYWPIATLFVYSGLLIAACLLLQEYNRMAGSLYFLLIALPLATAPLWVKIHCSDEKSILLADSIQGLVIFVAFPPVSIILGGILLFYLVISAWRNRQQNWPGLALLSVFLLLQHHAIRDWFRFVFEV